MWLDTVVSCSGPTDLIFGLTYDLPSSVRAQIDIKIITWPEATDHCSFLSSECNDAHYVFTALYKNSYQTKAHFCLQTNVSNKAKNHALCTNLFYVSDKCCQGVTNSSFSSSKSGLI